MNTTKLADVILKHGAHRSPDMGLCVMEAVAWVAGEPHSDAPACACPVIAWFARRLNDRISDDATRTRIMRPLVPLLVGTRTESRDVMIRRAYMAADFAAREAAPMALDARGRKEDAAKCRALAPIVDRETAKAAEAVLHAAYAAAYAAASAAASAAYAASAYAADADAYAAYSAASAASAAAASAAYAASAYAADADAYAAYSAASAAAAAAAADARQPVYQAAADCIRRMCEVADDTRAEERAAETPAGQVVEAEAEHAKGEGGS